MEEEGEEEHDFRGTPGGLAPGCTRMPTGARGKCLPTSSNIPQRLPAFVEVIGPVGAHACAGMQGAQRSSWLGTGTAMAAPGIGYVHSGVGDAQTLCPLRSQGPSGLFQLWAVCDPGLFSDPHTAHFRCCLHQGIGCPGNGLLSRFRDWLV